MKRIRNSAFRLNTVSGGSALPTQGLAGLLAAMRATLDRTDQGWQVALEPMHALDALAPWAALARSVEDEASGASSTIVFEQAALNHGAGVSSGNRLSVAATPAEWTIAMPAPGGRFDDALIGLDDLALRRTIITSTASRLVAVLVTGPLEPADVEAIGKAIAAGRSPMEAELRAVCVMTIQSNCAVKIEARERIDAVSFVAENFRHYLAALRDQPASSFAPPEVGLIDALFDRAGEIQVRPIETEVFSTAVDIGVLARGGEETGPADTSLIYDIYSNTWHGD